MSRNLTVEEHEYIEEQLVYVQNRLVDIDFVADYVYTKEDINDLINVSGAMIDELESFISLMKKLGRELNKKESKE